MFADNTLTPKEAVRLCALGVVAAGPCRYSALANEVRHFTSRIMGPSLDLLGLSVELLRYEGLVEAVDGRGMEDDATLVLSASGRRELKTLLTARLRPGSDLSKLIIALKFRFFDLLDAEEKQAQLDMLLDAVEGELARLIDLRAHHAGASGALVEWLDHDIAQAESRLAWLEGFRVSL